MRIIISPAKKMNVNTDIFSYNNLPIFLPQTRQITEYIQSLSFGECQKLWGCNDKIAQQNFERFQDIDLEHTLTPAILSYEGIQYQYMAPVVFSDDALIYIENHLRILSGFYGILKPFDGVTPYRLEMQAKAKINGTKDLYAFWGQRLYQELTKDDHQIINLASMLSYFGGYTVPAYAAAKGGVAQLTKALANEWASKGICVNAIAPGYMATQMNTRLIEDPKRNTEILARIPMGRWGNEQDMKGIVVFLASKASDYLSGAVIPVDGGYLGR